MDGSSSSFSPAIVFSTDRLTLNCRRALNALFELGLVAPHGFSGSQVALSAEGRKVLNYANAHKSNPDPVG